MSEIAGMNESKKTPLIDVLNTIESLSGVPQEGNAHEYIVKALAEAKVLAESSEKESKEKALTLVKAIEDLVRDFGGELNINFDTTWTKEMLPAVMEITQKALEEVAAE